MPAGYGVVLILWYAYYGVLFSFSLGLVFLALLPLTLLIGRTAQFVKELTPFIVLLMSYEALQGVAGSLTLVPVIHQAGSGASYGIIEAVQSAFLSPDLTDLMSLFLRSPFSPRDWLSNPTLVLKQDPLQEIRLLACGLLLCFTRLLHPSSLRPSLVQRSRLQLACNHKRPDRLLQPFL